MVDADWHDGYERQSDEVSAYYKARFEICRLSGVEGDVLIVQRKGKGGRGCTHDVACCCRMTIDFASPRSRDRARRVPADPGSRAITMREAP